MLYYKRREIKNFLYSGRHVPLLILDMYRISWFQEEERRFRLEVDRKPLRKHPSCTDGNEVFLLKHDKE